MRHKTFAIIMMLITFSITNLYAQTDWILDNSNSYISTSVIDSITFTKEGNSYIQNLWHKGCVIEKGIIEEGYSYEPKEVLLKYEYFSFEGNDMEGILTESGLYAILQHTQDSTGYILTNGNINDESYSCILFDSLGYVTNVKTSDNGLFQVIYSPNEMLLIDFWGTIVAEIPYTEFDNKEEASAASRRNFRKASDTDFTQTLTYKGLLIGDRIYSYLKNPRKAGALDLTNYILNGIGKRNGELIARLIAAGFNPYDPLAWIAVFQTADELYYFGNTQLTALDAIPEGCCSFVTPCKVEGFTPTIKELLGRYGNTLNYSYTLKMSAQTTSVPHKEKQSKTRKIDDNGTFNDFKFDFQELQTEYMYEPSLTLEASYKGEYIDEKNMRLAELGLPYSIESGHTYHINCTIKGNRKTLVTGSVSSTVEKVNNVKTTTADIICSFSTVPNGANCIVCISREGSDIGLTFSGTPGKSSQIIKATGLSVNSSYVATTYITYNGRKYDGVNSVSFTTKGPSGAVISVNNVTDKSAVARCQFSGVESGVEYGVICKSSNQSLTFPASGKEGEQSVTMSGLTPATSYQCYAYVKTSNHYQEQENGVSFTTNPPDISGTWSCKETHYDRAGNPYYTTYSLTLKEDGTVTMTNSDGSNHNIDGNSLWSFSSTGNVSIYMMDLVMDSYLHWQKWTGKVDDVKNPQKITGYMQPGNWNTVIGTIEGDACQFEMTR